MIFTQTTAPGLPRPGRLACLPFPWNSLATSSRLLVFAAVLVIVLHRLLDYEDEGDGNSSRFRMRSSATHETGPGQNPLRFHPPAAPVGFALVIAARSAVH